MSLLVPDILSASQTTEDTDTLDGVISSIADSGTIHLPDRHHLQINPLVTGGAFVGSLLVLETLPEEDAAWNHGTLQETSRPNVWRRYITAEGPERQLDRASTVNVMYPYAGTVYYIGPCNHSLNTWQSLLYSACIATIRMEFGIEALKESPTIQDIFITPLVSSLIGEGFVKLKQGIAGNRNRLAGTPVLGNVEAYLMEQINELAGLITVNLSRKLPIKKPTYGPKPKLTFSLRILRGRTKIGLSMRYTF